ncbi:MAG: methyltransferase domain-containing protein [Proteobacteria bacterium]|nr:methyltransferase domain-containing protein [Pseudomonadota bacterium]
MSGPPTIFDKKAYGLHRARAARLGGSFLAVEAAEGIAERLAPVNRTFGDAFDLASRDESFALIKPFARTWSRLALSDDETLSLPTGRYDLAISILSLHAVNDLPGALIQIRRALKPDGLFIAALFGGETLRELRDSLAMAESEITGGVSPRVAPFADVRDLGGLLQRAGFALPVADIERTVVRYRDFATLVKDLRALGETNALEERLRAPLRRDVLAGAMAHYASRHSEDGRFTATFDILYLTGWVPHESQQKPLRPGAAKTRLADALGTQEHAAGEQTKPR